MGTRKTTKAAENRARALHAEGRSVREIAVQLSAEGFRAGRTTVAEWLKTAAKPAVQPAPDTSDDLDTCDPIPLLRRSVTALEAAIKIAEAEGRLSELSTLSRTLHQALAQIARLTPAEPPARDEDPQLIAAAAQAREKILERVRRRAQARP